jgi:putative membrane protein
MIELLLIILFCLLGVFVGICTGLLPGLHVNNVAMILLSFSGSIILFCTPLINFGVSTNFIIVLLAGFILSIAMSHTFFDAIPTTFLGAPDEDSALSVFPAHRMLLDGNGYRAVALTAIGSFGAVLVCLLLLFPLRYIVGSPLFFYETIQDVMIWVLICLSIIMIATEKARISFLKSAGLLPSFFGMGFALFVFILSGIFGMVILDFPVTSPIGLPATVLFPALAGLFGMPTLVTSVMTKPVIPQQNIEPVKLTRTAKKYSVVSVFTGSLTGIFVSIIPGVTSATGTVLAMNLRKRTDHEQTLITLSAVNTAGAFAAIVLLFIILRARSGVALVVQDLIPVEEWTSVLMPVNLIYFLIFLLLAGVFSYFLTLYFGKVFAKKFTHVPYQLLIILTIILITSLVVLFTGIFGLIILLSATLIGLIPMYWGVRRSHCMGVLLIPIILYFL